MNEQKNNLENNNPENLDYSFDFANQVETEPKPATQPSQVDVSVPVMEEAVIGAETVSPVTPAQPQMETITEAPVVEPAVAPSQTSATQPAQVDVSVPVVEQTVAENTTTETTVATANNTEEIKDGKSTIRFVVILVIIIVAFIIALPFILNFLGY